MERCCKCLKQLTQKEAEAGLASNPSHSQLVCDKCQRVIDYSNWDLQGQEEAEERAQRNRRIEADKKAEAMENQIDENLLIIIKKIMRRAYPRYDGNNMYWRYDLLGGHVSGNHHIHADGRVISIYIELLLNGKQGCTHLFTLNRFSAYRDSRWDCITDLNCQKFLGYKNDQIIRVISEKEFQKAKTKSDRVEAWHIEERYTIETMLGGRDD